MNKYKLTITELGEQFHALLQELLEATDYLTDEQRCKIEIFRAIDHEDFIFDTKDSVSKKVAARQVAEHECASDYDSYYREYLNAFDNMLSVGLIVLASIEYPNRYANGSEPMLSNK